MIATAIIRYSMNEIMYIGIGLITFGFLLFIFAEMRVRAIDRKIALSNGTWCSLCGCMPKPDEWSVQVQGVCIDCG